jgi:hypothetical protein
MKIMSRVALLIGFVAMSGAGCLAQDAPAQPEEVSSSVAQELTDECSAWTTCYLRCDRFCSTTASCTTCKINCDATFPSAPGSCPFPEG